MPHHAVWWSYPSINLASYSLDLEKKTRISLETTEESNDNIIQHLQSYRVSLVVWQLGGVDLDLHDSPGWMAAIVVTYCQSRMVEHLKSESTQPNCQTTRGTLY